MNGNVKKKTTKKILKGQLLLNQNGKLRRYLGM